MPREVPDADRGAALVRFSDAIQRAALAALRTSGDRARAVLEALGTGEGELEPFVARGSRRPPGRSRSGSSRQPRAQHHSPRAPPGPGDSREGHRARSALVERRRCRRGRLRAGRSERGGAARGTRRNRPARPRRHPSAPRDGPRNRRGRQNARGARELAAPRARRAGAGTPRPLRHGTRSVSPACRRLRRTTPMRWCARRPSRRSPSSTFPAARALAARMATDDAEPRVRDAARAIAAGQRPPDE